MDQEISLWGNWGIKLGDIASYEELDNKISIPGTLQEQGFGNDIDIHIPWVSSLHDRMWHEREEYKVDEELGVLVPFLSQPKKHYLGKAWYGREFNINTEEEGYYYFHIEIVRWNTQLWLDDRTVGEVTSLCYPHEFYLGHLTKGTHRILLCVDNDHIYPYRPDGHMVSDALGATFHGLVGEVKLVKRQWLQVENIRIIADTKTKMIRVEGMIHNLSEIEFNGIIKIGTNRYPLHVGKETLECSYRISYPEDTPLWDEYNPHLEELHIEILSVVDGSSTSVFEDRLTFGFRRIEVIEDKFYLNERQVFFRGTHSGGDFPLTGYPSYKKEDWMRIFTICKQWGLNFMRFHSFCPPKAAFDAADELGYYLQVECGMWNEFNEMQKGHESHDMIDILWKETKGIIDTFGNHPSFLMLSPSNEPGGRWFESLTGWVKKVKGYDERRIYTAQSGWFYPMEPKDIYGTDYVYFHRSGYGLKPGGTIRNTPGWHGKDYYPSIEGITYPVISHELGQWTSYPDFSVIDKFKGYLTPSNYMVFRENARKNGVLHRNQEFAYNSGKRKVQLYKQDIEATLRTPSIYGFELLDLHDYIGQGTALVGMLDPFWEEKGFITSKEFTQFCSETVLLLRIEQLIYTKKNTLHAPLEICHFGREKMENVSVTYRIMGEDGRVWIEETMEVREIPIGKNTSLGTIDVSLGSLEEKKEYVLEVVLRDTSREIEEDNGITKNTWNFWVMEDMVELCDNEDIGQDGIISSISLPEFENNAMEHKNKVYFTDSILECIEWLEKGCLVIYQPIAKEHRYDSVPLSSKTSFWNSQMGPSYARGMGIVCNPSHKALKDFPTKEYSDWQWSEILDKGHGLNLSYLPKDIEPIISPIDDWNRNYPLGLLLECNVGKGKVLIVTSDIIAELGSRLSARQLRNSIVRYARSEWFQPSVTVTTKELKHAFFPRTIMNDLGCSVEQEYESMIDGKPQSLYLKENGYPLIVTLQIKEEKQTKGLLFLPRQNDRGHIGDPKSIQIRAKCMGEMKVVYQGEILSSFSPKELLFEHSILTSYIEVEFIAGYSIEDCTWYEQQRDGWYRKKGHYQDTTLAVAQLAILLEDVEFRAQSLANNINTEKEELHSTKSTTKEIDN